MPVSEAVYNVCHEGLSLAEEATRLMTRERKDELAGIFLTAKDVEDGAVERGTARRSRARALDRRRLGLRRAVDVDDVHPRARA